MVLVAAQDSTLAGCDCKCAAVTLFSMWRVRLRGVNYVNQETEPTFPFKYYRMSKCL